MLTWKSMYWMKICIVRNLSELKLKFWMKIRCRIFLMFIDFFTSPSGSIRASWRSGHSFDQHFFSSKYDNCYRVCHDFRLKVTRWLFSSLFWSLLKGALFFEAARNCENWLGPKTKPSEANLTKLRLSKSVKHSVSCMALTFRFTIHCYDFIPSEH